MRHLTLIAFILIVVCHCEMVSQPCLPGGITFFSQSEIDNFPNNYPNCSEIEGYVNIFGGDIKDLKGLNFITFIGGGLAIMLCDSLTSLSGLDNLTHIEGGTDWGINNSLVSLDGLQNLTYIGGHLYIHDNPQLISLSALENLTIVNGSIYLSQNNSLTTLSGIDFVDSDSITGLSVRRNSILSTCNVESICNYLASPNGTLEISENNQGCDSPIEVVEACTVGITAQQSDSHLSVYPNPFITATTIEYELTEPTHIQLTIYNTIGEVVYTAEDRFMAVGKHSLTWSADLLPEGMYYALLRSEEGVSVVKMVKQ